MQKTKIKLIIGKRYLNPYLDRYFEIKGITADKVSVQYDNEEIKDMSFDIIQPLVEKSVMDRSISGVDCSCNLSTDDFPMFLDNMKRSGANIGTKSIQILTKIKEDYKKDIPEEWLRSANEWIYRESPKKKGHLMKKFYLSLIDSADTREVEKNPANNHDNGIEIYSKSPGHDGIVGGRKKAIRMACKFGNSCTFFQIRKDQDFQDLVFLFVYPDHVQIYEIPKKNFIEYLKDNESEIVWAGGKEKREAIEGKIEKNDLFHWNVKLPLDDEMFELYNFHRIV